MFKWFQNRKVGTKIGGGFGLLIIIVIFMTYMGYSGLTNVSHKFDIGILTSEAHILAGELRTLEKDFMVANSQESIDRLNEIMSEVEANLAETKDLMRIAQEREEIDDLMVKAEAYLTAFNTYASETITQNELRADFVEKEKVIISGVETLMVEQNGELEELLAQGADLDIIENKIASVNLTHEIIQGTSEIGIQERNFIINLHDDTVQEEYAQRTLAAFANVEVALKELQALLQEQTDIQKVEKYLADLAAGKKAFEDIVASELIKDQQKPIMIQAATVFEDQVDQLTKKKMQEISDISATSISNIIIAAGIALVIGVLLALIITRMITRPLIAGVKFAREIANGNFDVQKLQVKSKDEVGNLAQALNNMRLKLNNILIGVRNSASTVQVTSEELSDGNQDLSQRTEEQASSLEEFSASIEEIVSSMETSSSSATEADGLSKETMDSVVNGQTVVEEMQGAMKEITQSSRKIADIINTVNDIAFQTNLLALNAAVEAARAGESGRGFAVVAAEVRNLAGRSAESAEEIERLIKESISRIENGNQLMDKTGAVLHEIVANTDKTNEVISKIAYALREQTTAAEEIRQTIEELNQITQQNASLVEEIASSSENMSGEAMELGRLVEQFKLAEETDSGRVVEMEHVKKETKSSSKKAAATEEEDFTFDEDDFERF